MGLKWEKRKKVKKFFSHIQKRTDDTHFPILGGGSAMHIKPLCNEQFYVPRDCAKC